MSWHLRQDGSVFTAAGYQQVSEIAPGTASEPSRTALRQPDVATVAPSLRPYAQSDETVGITLRVGIDLTGGLDPLSCRAVLADAAPYDQWQRCTSRLPRSDGDLFVHDAADAVAQQHLLGHHPLSVAPGATQPPTSASTSALSLPRCRRPRRQRPTTPTALALPLRWSLRRARRAPPPSATRT